MYFCRSAQPHCRIHWDSYLLVTPLRNGASVGNGGGVCVQSRMMATKGGVSFYNTKMDEVRQYLEDNHVDIHRRRQVILV